MCESATPLAIPLDGSLVELKPLTDTHREDLWRIAQSPEIWTWTSHIAATRTSFDIWFEKALRANDSGERGVFAVFDCRRHILIGSTSFHAFYPADRVVEIGASWLDPGAWGTGANIESKLLLLGDAFERLSCLRVEFKTDVRNERSRAALCALPAQYEGILRKQRTLPGIGTRDSAIYSVIDDEWPAVRKNLERRLSRSRPPEGKS